MSSSSYRTPSTIPIFVGPIIRRELDKPSVVYMDINFLPNSDEKIDEKASVLVFQNFFTSSLVIQQRSAVGVYKTM